MNKWYGLLLLSISIIHSITSIPDQSTTPDKEDAELLFDGQVPPDKSFRRLGVFVDAKTAHQFSLFVQLHRLLNNDALMCKCLPEFMKLHHNEWKNLGDWLNPQQWVIRNQRDYYMLSKSHERYKAINQMGNFISNQRIKALKRRTFFGGILTLAAATATYCGWDKIKQWKSKWF